MNSASLKYCNDDNCLFGGSYSLSAASNYTQTYIINQIANQIGLSNVYVNSDTNLFKNLDTIVGAMSYSIKTDPVTGKDILERYVAINNQSTIFKNGNYYDILCTLIHEQDHYNNYDSPIIEGETNAYLATIYSEYFQYASQYFQDGTYIMYNYYSCNYEK